MTYRPSNTRGVPDYKYPQNTSPALRINEGHKLAEFYSATTASCGVSVVQYCSAFYNKGINVRVIQALARHKDMSTTQRYIDYNESKLRNAIELV